MRITTFLAILLSVVSANAGAGTEQVTSYVGNIGKYPIHLSVQKTDALRTGGLTVVGSYYYDKQMSPIPLYGKFNGAGILELCESHDSDTYQKIFIHGSRSPVETKDCQFSLTIDASGAQGRWASNGRSYDVALRLLSASDSAGKVLTKASMEIPYWGQTTNYMFLGDYGGAENPGFKIRVINKSTKAVTQEIVPDQDECPGAGYFSTMIYMNVERDHDSEQVLLLCYDGRNESFSYYAYNKISKKFDFVGHEH